MSVADASTVESRRVASLRLKGKVAVVTGTNGGLGSAIAEAFALEGADVLCAYHSPKAVQPAPEDGSSSGGGRKRSKVEDPQLLEAKKTAAAVRAAGTKALVVHCDTTSEEQVKAMFTKAEAELGGVDLMVAVAGIGKMAPFLDTTVGEFEAVHNVNVKGTYLCIREAGAAMKRGGRAGSIITLTSVHGLGGTHYNAIYGSSKQAVIGLTKGAAFDLAKDNIRCNAVAPGAVPVPNDPCPTSRYPPKDEKDGNTQMTDAWMLYTPMSRWGYPEDIGRACVFLASDDAAFMTGQVLAVDGGISAGIKIPSFADFPSNHRGLPQNLKEKAAKDGGANV